MFRTNQRRVFRAPEGGEGAGGGEGGGEGTPAFDLSTLPADLRAKLDRFDVLERDSKAAFAERDAARGEYRTLAERIAGGEGRRPEAKPEPEADPYAALDEGGQQLARTIEDRAYARARAELAPLAKDVAERRERDAETTIAADVQKYVGDDAKPGRFPLASPERIFSVYATFGDALETGRISRDDFDRRLEAAVKESHEAGIKRHEWYQKQETDRATAEAAGAKKEAEKTAKAKLEARRGSGFRSGGTSPPEKVDKKGLLDPVLRKAAIVDFVKRQPDYRGR